MNQKDSQYPRIAWLLTSAFYYWQPMLKELTKLFPHTMTFTPRWHGYAPGFEDSFSVEIVGERKIISLQKSDRLLPVEPVVLPRDAGARHRLPQDAGRQLGSDRPDRAGQ